MIDPTQLPILLKAIDFVFDEGRKILEERRERRKNSDSAPTSETQEPAKESLPKFTKKISLQTNRNKVRYGQGRNYSS